MESGDDKNLSLTCPHTKLIIALVIFVIFFFFRKKSDLFEKAMWNLLFYNLYVYMWGGGRDWT